MLRTTTIHGAHTLWADSSVWTNLPNHWLHLNLSAIPFCTETTLDNWLNINRLQVDWSMTHLYCLPASGSFNNDLLWVSWPAFVSFNSELRWVPWWTPGGWEMSFRDCGLSFKGSKTSSKGFRNELQGFDNDLRCSEMSFRGSAVRFKGYFCFKLSIRRFWIEIPGFWNEHLGFLKGAAGV